MQDFFVALFLSTSHAIKMEQAMGAVFPAEVMPTPREITSSCGLALRFSGEFLAMARQILAQSALPYRIYQFSGEKVSGKRAFQLLAAREEDLR